MKTVAEKFGVIVTSGKTKYQHQVNQEHSAALYNDLRFRSS